MHFRFLKYEEMTYGIRMNSNESFFQDSQYAFVTLSLLSCTVICDKNILQLYFSLYYFFR